MRTTKPTSTISYNSMGFLLGVLDRLVENGVIQFYALIKHLPEEDENKEHIHVYLEPAKAVDTLWLRKQFIEADPEHPENPLGCMPMQASKWVDWYWYDLHDRAYLAAKGMSRKYHYQPDEVLTNDTEYMAEKVRQNPNPKAQILQVLEMMQEGYQPLQIALRMNVPISRLTYWMQGLHSITAHMVDITDRNGHANHEGALELHTDQIEEIKDDKR